MVEDLVHLWHTFRRLKSTFVTKCQRLLTILWLIAENLVHQCILITHRRRLDAFDDLWQILTQNFDQEHLVHLWQKRCYICNSWQKTSCICGSWQKKLRICRSICEQTSCIYSSWQKLWNICTHDKGQGELMTHYRRLVAVVSDSRILVAFKNRFVCGSWQKTWLTTGRFAWSWIWCPTLWKFVPQHDKTKKTSCVPSKDSDQPGFLLSLIRIFAVHSVGG